MRNNIYGTMLALLCAVFIPEPVLAGQPAEQAESKAVEQKTAQESGSQAEAPKTEKTHTAEPGDVPEQEADAVDGGTSDVEGDLPPEPQSVVKTKTKSNQSND